MNLHLDPNAFQVLLNDIHEKTGYRLDVLEKDYYVVLLLKELAEMQGEGLKAYFKGGTALYKALRTTNRFSEDIDLSVDTRDLSRTQNDKQLEKATKKYTSLERLPAEGKTNRSEVIAVYGYSPLTQYDKDDALQRFGKLKVESTSFTISEPVSDMEVSAMIYDLASDEQRKILSKKYTVYPFSVKTMTLERIFIDKLFAAEAYVRKSDDPHRAFEAAKHIYDLSVMSTHPQIIALFNSETEMQRLLQIRLTEEQSRLDGVPDLLPKNFVFFDTVKDNAKVRQAYEIMQRQYVFRECDRIQFDVAVEALSDINENLCKNKAWLIASLPIKPPKAKDRAAR